MGDSNEDLIGSKVELRDRMRRMRRELPDRAARSARIVDHLTHLEVVATAGKLMVYTAVSGEVDVAAIAVWAADRDVDVAVPEDGVAAAWPDVIVVPGTAFTVRGERVGQGGGWYDRFLPGRRADAVSIGVCFSPQLVPVVPTEVHDVILDCVVTEDGPIWPDR